MVLTRRQEKLLIHQFNNINTNIHVNMAAPIIYVLSSFEGNINTGYPTEIKLHLQATKEIDKEAEKLDISVSNAKDIIDHFSV